MWARNGHGFALAATALALASACGAPPRMGARRAWPVVRLESIACGNARETQRDVLHWVRECETGNRWSCLAIGRVLEDGYGVHRDLAGAAMIFERGCEEGFAQSCFELAMLRRERMSADLRVDAWLRRGCDGGSGDACFELAIGSWRSGLRVAPPSRDLLERACQLGDQGNASACFLLAAMTVPSDPASFVRRTDLEKTACSVGGSGASYGCSCPFRHPRDDVDTSSAFCTGLDDSCEAALAAPIARQRMLVVEPFERACAAGLEYACEVVGVMFEYGVSWRDVEGGVAGHTLEPDTAKARVAYERGCRLGSLRACSRQAVVIRTKDPRGAATLLRSSCDRGDPVGCRLLSSMYGSELLDIENWEELASALLVRACALGDATVCHVVER